MTEYVYHEEQFMPKEKAVIPVMTHAFLYGTAVFEGLRAYYNKEEDKTYIFRPKEHFERLLNSAKIMYMKELHTIDEYIKILKELLRKNNYKKDAYIRPIIYKSAGRIGPHLIDNPDKYTLFTFPMDDYFENSGLNVCVSNWRRNSDNSIPPRAKINGAYVNASLISTDARLNGFDDAIVLSQSGKVAEGAAMNLFLIINGKLVTTTTTSEILTGVTRNTILTIAKEELNIEVEERVIDRSELYCADEAFFSGTGAQIAPIISIDKRNIGDGKVGKLVSKIQNLYNNVVRGKIEKYKDWCVSIDD
ncbi:branched-chain amino acid transaminase [bacterium]|nr:branched-chain amino acid transaminase [bacterium]